MRIHLRPLSAIPKPLNEATDYLKELKIKLQTLKKSKQAVTKEELNELKQKNREIIEERDALKVSLNRVTSNINKNMFVPKSRDAKNSILAQINFLNESIRKKRTELDKISNSDLKNEILEIEEESKLLFLENQRLSQEKYKELKQVSEYEQISNEISIKYSREQFQKKQAKIKALELEINDKIAKNSNLHDIVMDKKSTMECRRIRDKRRDLNNQIDILKSQISNEMHAIAELDREIADERSKYLHSIYQ